MTMRPELRRGALRLTLAPEAGGAVAGFWLDRPEGPLALMRPLPAGAGDALHSGMFPMLPFANCIRDNRFSFGGRDWQVAPNMDGARLNFHGSGWRLPWQVAETGAARAVLTLDADDGIWRYHAAQSFALQDDGLIAALTVTNRGTAPMPFGFGLHPWFPRHGPASVAFDATGQWSLTPEGEAVALGPVPAGMDYRQPAPLPRRNLNTCYAGWSGSSRIVWQDEGIALHLCADPVMGHLMVHVPAHDLETFCLEPQSNPPCGFDGLEDGRPGPGIHVLGPGESLSGQVAFRLRFRRPR
ncbi:aldose 1-epimerase [Frigidibacter sp. ROC022]|uniref:aldose 1-epimerase n=1 Tax=Frigidibacter sp. ROC022 TaxID=2971796 RepID=UPI00215A8F53|nr:aldose 1-epimerase [Frigidibacter sp. ROC022]MCR8726381.1 aldose 1-epimerase [Frigidibacter sp. ROC022]